MFVEFVVVDVEFFQSTTDFENLTFDKELVQLKFGAFGATFGLVKDDVEFTKSFDCRVRVLGLGFHEFVDAVDKGEHGDGLVGVEGGFDAL